MLRAMLRYVLGGVPRLPAPGGWLLGTVAGLALVGLNLTWEHEIWPTTPGMHKLLPGVFLGLVLALLPQLAWWGWRWLRAYAGPQWLRWLATCAYLAATTVAALLWMLALAGAAYLWG